MGSSRLRVHQQVLGGTEAADLVPAEHLIAGEYVAVVHHPLGVGLSVLVDIVADHHVHQLVVPDELAQLIQRLVQGGHIHPVVGVHHLIVDTPGVADALVDALTVAAVGLMDGPDNVGVLLLVAVADGRGVVLGGAVVHQDDLDVVAALEQGLHAVLHIGSGVITGDGKGNQLIHM